MSKIKITPLHRSLLASLYVAIFVIPVGVQAAQNVSRSFSSVTSIPVGSVVALKDASGDDIVLANTSNADRTVGVVVRADDSLLGINPDDTKTQVATSGLAQVTVNTANGQIQAGDKVTVSALSGTAQKSIPGDVVVGFAKEKFTGTEEGSSTQSVTRSSGQGKDIQVGVIDVELAIGAENPASNVSNLNGLQQLVRSFTGRDVSMPRIIASIVIAVLTLLSLIALLYASIYGSIISIGRNPLARNSILRGLTVVLVMAALGVLLSIVVIYLLLR